MKKVILVVIVAVLSAACKKSYNCVCTITTAPTGIVTTSITPINDTWQNVTWACNNRNVTSVNSETVTCAIQ
ncbi:MAG TPA: hypothetical protein VF411_12825 [Bacteroidia bacterium]